MLKKQDKPAVTHLDRLGDWEALQLFSEADRRLSPEEYAARHAHEWDCFALGSLQYRDSQLGAWVRRVGELLDNPEELERCRARYLTADELAEVHRLELGRQ